MRKGAIVAASVLALGLTACGSDPAPDPVEQVVVREPGQPEKSNPLPTREPGAPPIPSAVGERAFAVCSGCHVAEKGEPSAAGPNLYGVVGRKAASLGDFAYSDALKASGITWTEAELEAFIANPSGKVPGTSMAAGAISDAETRKAIIAYLNTLGQ
jgi:cytochrome c